MGVLTSKAFVREQENLNDFQAADRQDVRRVGAEHDAGRDLRADRVDAREPRDGTRRSRSAASTCSHGVISVGTLVAFMAYARSFFDPVEQLGRWFAEMQMAQASAERIISLIDAVPTIRDSDDVLAAIAVQRVAPERATSANDGGPADIERIELKDVCFAYDDGRPVLDHVNLRSRAGETIAIVGADRRRQEHARQPDLPVLRADRAARC